jgi:hypothetical protein
LVEDDWGIFNAGVAIAGVVTNAVSSLLRSKTGVGALKELNAISDTDNPRTVRPGENAENWFNKIIGGKDNAKPFGKGGPKAPKLWGEVPEGGRAYFRPNTSTNPAIEIYDVPGFPKSLKYHFPPKVK